MRLSLAALAFLVGAVAGAQQHTRTAKAHSPSLHWLLEGRQELGQGDRIRFAKTLLPADRAALIKAIAAQYLAEGKTGDALARQEAREATMDTRIKLIDLNGDGVVEVMAQATGANGGCSPTGNCPLMVFMRTSKGYKLILDGDSFQNFAVRPTRTNGFNDLVLGMHGSASEQELHVFKFRSGWYREESCYDAEWQKLEGDEWQEVKEAIITPCRTNR